MTQYVYRCCSLKEGRFFSTVAEGDAAVEYQIGKWATAPTYLAEAGYHLLYFETFFDALVYRGNAEDLVIMACEMQDEIDSLPPCLNWFNTIGEFKFARFSFGGWAPGSHMARSLRPVKIVSYQ